ncbi:MAG: AMP-binding protein, partial [Bacteroidales bacterium]|nr:AMP-binding protein [Bacteroidales bacterium]
SILAFENYPVSDEIRRQFGESDSSLHIEALDNQEESFNDIALAAFERDGRLQLNLTFDKEQFSEADMQNALSAWRQVLMQVADNPETKVADTDLLPEDEKQRLIALGTGEALDYDKSKTFVDLFREQAKKTPDAVAVVDKDSQLTYEELDEASGEYSKTVTPGTFVCLEMPRVKEFVVAVLGIWKAGSAYVPIDTEYPEERKKYMRGECDGKPLPSPDIAYMIYTSGSTGKPKGVLVQHTAVCAFALWNGSQLKNHFTSKVAHYVNFAFDASLYDMVCPLYAGGEIHIISEKVKEDMSLLREYINTHNIRSMSVPTSVGDLILNSCPDLSIDYLILGGERLHMPSRSGIKLLNSYGPTEFTVCSAYYEVSDETTDNVPIGRPVPGSQSFICDEAGHLLPQGTTGELCLAGPQMAIGYYNNPELTAERFVDISVGGKTVKIYKTGDLCRWNADGQLEYIGRIDNQVKLRGFRIELGEIESAALQIEEVKQAVAMVRNERIVLYYTGITDNGADVDVVNDRLTEALSASLPEYMVPRAFVQLDAMPLTPNGKIDRKALPEPEFVREEYVAPESRNEKLLCKAIEELLGLERIGITDSFRFCGISSIQAMRLNLVLHKMNIHVNLSSIIKADNVRNLCQYINEGIDNSDVGSWLNGFDAAKPTIVLCCGVIKAGTITNNLLRFSEKYNIYVLQPIFNAWTDIEELSHEDIITRFLELMKRDILQPYLGQVQADISCIIGFSYGGELAYHLAVRWQALTKQQPMVFMGDTVITDVKSDNQLQKPAYENEMEAYYCKLDIEFFSERERLSVPDYQGRVILISAEKETPHRSSNEQEWKAHNPRINIIPVNDNHDGLFKNAEHYDEYLSLIENKLAQK